MTPELDTSELTLRFIAACRDAGEDPIAVRAYLMTTYINAAEAMAQAVREEKAV